MPLSYTGRGESDAGQPSLAVLTSGWGPVVCLGRGICAFSLYLALAFFCLLCGRIPAVAVCDLLPSHMASCIHNLCHHLL